MIDISPETTPEAKNCYLQALVERLGQMCEDGEPLPAETTLQEIAAQVAVECGIELVTRQ